MSIDFLRPKVIFFVGAFLLFPLLSMAQDATGFQGKKPIKFNIEGRTTSRYEFRKTYDDADQDFYQYLSARLNNEANKVSGEFFGRLSWDIGSVQNKTDHYTFDSIDDSFDYNANVRIYYGYVKIREPKLLGFKTIEAIRIGRQYVYEGETVHFDGVRLDSHEFKFLGFNPKLSFYGGIPVNLFESSSEGDGLLGGSVQLKPYVTTRLRVNYQLILDETSLYGDKHTDITQLAIWQRVGTHLNLHGQTSSLDNYRRDMSLRATLNLPEQGFFIQGSYFEQLETLGGYALEFDPFYTATGALYPYQQSSINGTKEFSDNFMVGGGLSTRDLTDEDDKGPYNHEFNSWYINPIISNFPIEDTQISITNEVFDTSNNDISTLSAVISHKCSKKLKSSIGTYYSLYKYDYYQNEEKDKVRTYFVGFEYKLRKGVKATFDYEFESDGFDRYANIKFGLAYPF